MKKKNWYQSLSLADDKYIAEAHPARDFGAPKRKKVFASLLAACACFAFVLTNLWLFIPFSTTPPTVAQYADSEYYGLIEKINLLTFQKPKYKNNAQKLLASAQKLVSNGLGAGKYEDMAPTSPDNGAESNTNGTYVEITDNQVGGIVEADRIKRSDTHIYYLDYEVLRIYAIDGENTKEVGSYRLFDGRNYYVSGWEFYLSEDCKTATVITQNYRKTEIENRYERYVDLISLDVSDPENVVKKDEFQITGEYTSSRKANGSILLLCAFAIDKNTLDFDDEGTFLPQIDDGSGKHSIPADAIVTPETLNSTRYTVVLKLDEDTLDLEGTMAYLSFSEDVYVSEDHVFLTHVFSDTKENEAGVLIRNSMTEISCLAYGGDHFEKKGSVTVRGYVKDQWSMDEYEGILRVVTTTNATRVSSYSSGGSVSTSILETATGESNASLYCIDLTTFEIAASVIDFAPPHEEVQSVRFDKETAYVCTSIEMSDPVFFFDLSDLDNITYKDTGTIDGFSSSLINLGGGYLLGIGRGDRWSSLKVEVYEEWEDGVRSVCSYELAYATYGTDYKSYYVDRKNQLIGLGIVDYSYPDATRYVLLYFDGYDLIELVNTPLDGIPDYMRGVFVDGYMYMFGENDFKVMKVFE